MHFSLRTDTVSVMNVPENAERDMYETVNLNTVTVKAAATIN